MVAQRESSKSLGTVLGTVLRTKVQEIQDFSRGIVESRNPVFLTQDLVFLSL